MEDISISSHVRRFVNDYISSVGQLEMLLLLHMNPQQSWQAADIARELRTETTGTRFQLELLCRSGLLRKDEGDAYSYAPADDQRHADVTALAQAYLLRRVTIISLIFAKPPDTLRAFSDAFRLRKEDPK